MLEFTKKVLLTGVERRQPKKEGASSYILMHILGSTGQTMSFMYRGDENKIFSLEKMKEYNFYFAYQENGQYKNIFIIDIDLNDK